MNIHMSQSRAPSFTNTITVVGIRPVCNRHQNVHVRQPTNKLCLQFIHVAQIQQQHISPNTQPLEILLRSFASFSSTILEHEPLAPDTHTAGIDSRLFHTATIFASCFQALALPTHKKIMKFSTIATDKTIAPLLESRTSKRPNQSPGLPANISHDRSPRKRRQRCLLLRSSS